MAIVYLIESLSAFNLENMWKKKDKLHSELNQLAWKWDICSKNINKTFNQLKIKQNVVDIVHLE